MAEDEEKPEEEKEEQEDKPSEEEMASPDNVINQAEKIRDDLKTENDRYEQLVKRQEAMTARNMLGGNSEAGQEKETKIETQHEQRQRFEKGIETGEFKDFKL